MLKRALGLAMAVLIIPACSYDSDDWWSDDDREVRVYNSGNEAVYLMIDAEGGSNDGSWTRTLSPGEWYSEDFDGAFEVEIRVTRAGDGYLLYSDSFDVEDFDDKDGTIVIEVHP